MFFKKLTDKKVGNSNKMVNKSIQYTLADIPVAEEAVLHPLKVKFRPKANSKFKDIVVNTDSFNKPNFDNDFNYGSEILILLTLHFMSARKNIVLKKQMMMI